MTDVAPGHHVVASHLEIDPAGGPTLEEAFAARLGQVEDVDGFVRLEVWRDERDEGRYLMVTWWESPAHFRAYMRSEEHDRSHARVPTDPYRPRGRGLDRYTVVAR